MTTRFSLNPPIASDDTWAGRQKPSFQHDAHCADRAREWLAAGMENEQRAADRDRQETEHQLIANGERFLDAMSGTKAAIREAQIEAIWHDNMARRDKAAATYGEPESSHEFYAGRPGSQAEKVVLDCLRELRDIPETDRLYAKELTDAIAAVYLDLAWNAPRQRDAAKIRRRCAALFRIGAGEKA